MPGTPQDSDQAIPLWVREIMRTVKEVVPREFVGQIEINVFRGGISNINLKQSYKDVRGPR